VSTPISGIVNRTGVDLFNVAGETLAAAVARGRGAWLDGGGDAVVALVDTDAVVDFVGGGDALAAPGLSEQAETMLAARSATTASVRPGRCRRSQGIDSRSA
jgi:hypothetical protein